MPNPTLTPTITALARELAERTLTPPCRVLLLRLYARREVHVLHRARTSLRPRVPARGGGAGGAVAVPVLRIKADCHRTLRPLTSDVRPQGMSR
jgi:hypothetical protein